MKWRNQYYVELALPLRWRSTLCIASLFRCLHYRCPPPPPPGLATVRAQLEYSASNLQMARAFLSTRGSARALQ